MVRKTLIALSVVITTVVVFALSSRATPSPSTTSPQNQQTQTATHQIEMTELDLQSLVKNARQEEQRRLQVNTTTETSDTDAEDRLVQTIIKLQPSYEGQRGKARYLAELIIESAAEYAVNPYIVLSVAMKESSLLPNQIGGLGEQGFFQVMPRGYARRVCSGGCDSASASCNARTAICYLDHVRELCGDDPSIYVLAYGMSSCPTNLASAIQSRPVRRARGFLVDAVGEEEANEIWPI